MVQKKLFIWLPENRVFFKYPYKLSWKRHSFVVKTFIVVVIGEDVPKNDPCEFCTCESGSINCAIADCAPPECPDPKQEEGVCCPVCPSGNKI